MPAVSIIPPEAKTKHRTTIPNLAGVLNGFKDSQPRFTARHLKFTVVPREDMPIGLVLEEIKSLLLSNEVLSTAAIKEKRTATFELDVEMTPICDGAVASILSRMISASVYEFGTSKVVNKSPLAMEPNMSYAPLFDGNGRVRTLYRPTNHAGATGAKYAALMVNLLGEPPGSSMLVPMGGYLGEAIAGALCGYHVTVGDISPWVKTGREKVRFYTGESTLELSEADYVRVRDSVAEHRRRGIPLERLRNIEFSRWNATRLPFRKEAFDCSAFDPPFGRATKPQNTTSENPVEAAVEFANEVVRVIKRGGPIVMRIPIEWKEQIADEVLNVNLVGAFGIPNDHMAMIKFRKG